ncbi:MAG: citrate synthase family protein [Actinomycetota bacterium]|nr:citrate synthase family protein [Actinomycetota bacterium]
MSKERYLSGRDAAAELGVKLPTLYAYVSRGLIRSEPVGGTGRNRRYRAEDIQKLKERKEQRRDPSRLTENALHWGAPVMESAITLIEDGRLHYRGRDAVVLSKNHTLEQVAELIWTGRLPEGESAIFGAMSDALALYSRAANMVSWELAPVERNFGVSLQLAAARDTTAYDLRPTAVARTGARILRLLAATAVRGGSADTGVARVLQQGWAPSKLQAATLLDAALILCADHELNVSSFAARCVASAGATPYAATVAGLCALSGVKHGGNTERVEAFLKEAGTAARARDVMAGRLRRGEPIPGFGHPLYPEGDPRGRALLETTAASYPEALAVELASAVVEEASELIGEYPTLDFGLVILSMALGLPAGGALALFALGRTVGWIGHAIEQYQSGRMIRPRARYIGEQPLDQ